MLFHIIMMIFIFFFFFHVFKDICRAFASRLDYFDILIYYYDAFYFPYTLYIIYATRLFARMLLILYDDIQEKEHADAAAAAAVRRHIIIMPWASPFLRYYTAERYAAFRYYFRYAMILPLFLLFSFYWYFQHIFLLTAADILPL